MGSTGLQCSSKFAKYFLFFFNVIFWIAGGVVLGTGIWVLSDPNATKILNIATLDTNGGLVEAAAITLVVVGSIVFLTGFLGCCGAMRESACLLLLYASIVGFVLALQFIAGIMAVSFRDQIKSTLKKSLNTTVQERYGVDEEATEGMNIMQRTFRCCGAIEGPEEWKTSHWGLTANQSVPDTCCVLKNQDKLNETPEPVNASLCYQFGQDMPVNSTDVENYIFTQGCQPGLHNWIHDNAGTLIGVAFGLAGVQLLGVILACCLRSSIKNTYEYV